MQIGILGGGQLGRMLALAGYPLGLNFTCLDPSADSCAGDMTELIVADYDDPKALARLADECGVVTYEFENVPADALLRITDQVPVYPAPSILHHAQDRLDEKTLFTELEIPTPQFADASSLAELEAAIEEIELPVVVKTRRFGYDGKGQRVIREPSQIAAAWAELGDHPLLVESLVNFDSEVSLIAVRSKTGESRFYPLSQNRHHEGILRLSIPMANHPLQQLAEKHVGRLIDHLGYVGVLAFEFFVVGNALMANEIAPRVHNSGHWSIEGAVCSQFENHIRAIAGLPLGATSLIHHPGMINFIGSLPQGPVLRELLAMPGLHLHDYGKEPRAGRKVGHATAIANTSEELRATLRRLLELTSPELLKAAAV